MAGQIRPAPRSLHGRSVYVCLPESTTSDQHARIMTALAGVVRARDRILHQPSANISDPITAYARRHGHRVGSIVDELAAPDLIVIIVDPYGDNSSALGARMLAARGDSDIFIAELPDEL